MGHSAMLNRFVVVILALIVPAILGCSDDGTPTDTGGGGDGGAKVYYVCEDANGAEDGSSWDDAFTDPADAMALAKSGDQIWVEGGSYTNRADDLSIPYLTFKPGVEMYGGFDETMTEFSERDPKLHNPTLEGHNAYHVVVGAEGAVFDGFTVTRGRADDTVDNDDSRGAGLFVVDVTMTVANCTFRDNDAVKGGGAYIRNGTVTFDNCFFWGNGAWGIGSTPGGGALYAEGATVSLTGCTFTDNECSGDGGGGMFVLNSDITATGCVFLRNLTNTGNGGAIHYESDTGQNSARFENCLMYTNRTTARDGGAVFCKNVSPVFVNCTIAANTARNGGGIYNDSASPTLVNCILWGNTDSAGFPQISDNSGSVSVVTYTDIRQTGFDDPTNMNADPLFVTGPLGDYYLSQTISGQGADSPCIDSGSDTAWNLGWADRTTRTDDIPDANQVDLGFHYPIGN